MAFISSIQIGEIEDLVVPTKSVANPGRIVKSAIRKSPVSGPIEATPLGLEGDFQAEKRIHGGIDKAILAYSADHFSYWGDLARRPVLPGAFGENLTVQGLDETVVCIGDRYAIGQCTMEVSQPRQPCFKLSAHWKEGQMIRWVRESGFTGWYMRVLNGGEISAKMELRLICRPYPGWSVSRANQLMFGQVSDPAAMAELSALPELSADWKKDLG